MNNEIDLIQSALVTASAYKGLIWGRVMKGSEPFRASLNITINDRTFQLQIQVKRHLHAAVIERIIAFKNDLPSKCIFMLVADQVSANQAETLHKNGVAFMDTAGNMYLDLPGFHLFVAGKKTTISVNKSNSSRIFYRTALQVIFAFLTDPALDKNPAVALMNKTFRDIKCQTGVALGSIGAVIGNLLELGYIVEDQDLRFLVNRRQLFEKWVSDYIDHLRPKLISQRYRSRGGSWWAKVTSLDEGSYWGGEVAAAKLTGYLKPELATLYTKGDIRRMILDADLRLDPEGDIEVLRAFWGDWTSAVKSDCVHPILVYADLMASEIDRNMETARRVYEQCLRDIIEPRG